MHIYICVCVWVCLCLCVTKGPQWLDNSLFLYICGVVLQSIRQELPLLLRCLGGQENKGVLVSSDNPISVLGSNQIQGDSQDVFMVNALTEASTSFMVAGFDICTTPGNVCGNNVFSFVAASDNTEARIYKPFNSDYVLYATKTLARMDTYTVPQPPDVSGFIINASKPIAVLSGNSVNTIGMNATGAGDHLCMSLPAINQQGSGWKNYYVPPIAIRPDPRAFYVKVLMLHDSTDAYDVAEGILPPTLNRGQFREIGPVTSGDPVGKILCNNPCLVAQFNMGPGYDGEVNIDSFLMWIPPIDFKTKFVRFVTPRNENNSPMENKLMIVTWSKVKHLFCVDNANIGEWTEFATDADMVYKSMSMTDGVHEVAYVNATDEFGFLAWLYGKDPGLKEAYGTWLGGTTLPNQTFCKIGK